VDLERELVERSPSPRTFTRFGALLDEVRELEGLEVHRRARLEPLLQRAVTLTVENTVGRGC
jgi:hypothetical protein